MSGVPILVPSGRLARPKADLQEMKLLVYDMALPLAVFRSKSLQQLGGSYFQARTPDLRFWSTEGSP